MKLSADKYVILFLLAAELSFAQDQTNNANNKNNIPQNDLSTGRYNESTLYDKSNTAKEFTNRNEDLELKFYKDTKGVKNSFDVFSSVGSNISFGGFWDKYAVINFTPQMDIHPASFINIYANHNLNCLIPIDQIKEYSQSVILQSLTVMAVDNSFRLIFNDKNSNHWITDVISFAAKNLLINFLIKPVISNSASSSDPIIKYEYYYYSVSVNF